MSIRHSTALRGLLAAGATAGMVAALGGGSAASAGGGPQSQLTAGASTISMRADARGFRFTGSTQVRAGQPLRVRNLADPREGGPHTLTLVATNVVPRSRKAQKECFSPGKICLLGAIAHEFDEKTETLNRQLVEAGRPGWDKRFSRTARTGDSWHSDKKGEQFEQAVSARAGTVLRYLCLVHPEMQGKIKVVG
ncbi:MAG: hypothetical protein M3376_06305 [Actinomycetota bacterium]|nr:hypothetical protein [Actinomycetota bacterium]